MQKKSHYFTVGIPTLTYKIMQSQTQALDIVTLNCNLDLGNDFAVIEERTQWLENSKAIKDSLPFYRPYYVCAMHFWLLPDNNLIAGEGAKFDQNFEVTRRYLMQQKVIDIQQDLEIPDAYTVDTMLGNLKPGCLECDTSTLLPNQNKISIMGF
jgi:hypothetical protein